MFGLVVIEGMNLSGHPWIINEMVERSLHNTKTRLLLIHNS